MPEAQTLAFSQMSSGAYRPHRQDKGEEDEVEIDRNTFAKGVWSLNLVSPTKGI